MGSAHALNSAKISGMWRHFVNLLSRSWTGVLQALGTTTLAVVLFSILIPGVIWFASVLKMWRAGRHKEPPMRFQEAFGESVRSAYITAAITIIVWVIVFSCLVGRKIYSDHVWAVARIEQFQNIPKPTCAICPTCSKSITTFESKTSLRRRTLRIVKELNEFWSQRAHPRATTCSKCQHG